MTEVEDPSSSPGQGDEETLKALEESLYTRLREVLVPRIDALIEARAEYFLPQYYDRVVTSEIRRLETAIEHNGRRIDELRAYMDQRFDDVDRRFEQIDKWFEQIDKRFEQIDKWFEQIDRRFEQIDKRFEQVDRQFARIDDRFEGIERQLHRVNERIDQVNERIDQMNERIGGIDRTVRNWIIVGFAFLGILFTVLELALAP